MDLTALSIPNSVLQGVRRVTTRAHSVHIRNGALPAIAEGVGGRLAAGIDDVDVAFGSAGTLERDVNMILFETACNFCFWSERPETAWKVDVDGNTVGGWYAMAACFNSGARAGIPVWDAEWMAHLTVEKAQRLFAGVNGSIPLLELRVNNIVEAAEFLLRERHGQGLDMLRAAGFSAPTIAATVVRELPSFRDGAWYEGQWVWFLKRAQILPSDLHQLTARSPDFEISDRDQLTAFATTACPRYSDISARSNTRRHLPRLSTTASSFRRAAHQKWKSARAPSKSVNGSRTIFPNARVPTSISACG